MSIPSVFDPIKLEAETDLVLLHPDGSEEILVDGDTADDNNDNEKCAVLDQVDQGQLDISIKDNAGNLVAMKRSFSVKAELNDRMMFPIKSADGKLIIIWL